MSHYQIERFSKCPDFEIINFWSVSLSNWPIFEVSHYQIHRFSKCLVSEITNSWCVPLFNRPIFELSCFRNYQFLKCPIIESTNFEVPRFRIDQFSKCIIIKLTDLRSVPLSKWPVFEEFDSRSDQFLMLNYYFNWLLITNEQLHRIQRF